MNKNTKALLSVLILCVLAAPFFAFAQADPVMNIINRFITWFTQIALALVVVCIIIGGFLFITAGGDTGKVDSAKKFITFAVVGLIVVVSAEAIKNFFVTWGTN
jgi:type IV secretory pathway VirB2 component (pilin)